MSSCFRLGLGPSCGGAHTLCENSPTSRKLALSTLISRALKNFFAFNAFFWQAWAPSSVASLMQITQPHLGTRPLTRAGEQLERPALRAAFLLLNRAVNVVFHLRAARRLPPISFADRTVPTLESPQESP